MFIPYIFTMRYTLYSQNLKRLPILTDFRFQFQSSFTVILYKLTLTNDSHIYRVTTGTCQIHRQREKRLLLAPDYLLVW